MDNKFPTDSPHQSNVARKLREWLEFFLEDDVPSSLLLTGPVGTGKTVIAAQCARYLIQDGIEHSAQLVVVPELLGRIQRTYSRDSDESEASVLDELFNVDVLILDDLGSERPTEWVREPLFTLINHRYEHDAATIVTTNLTLKQLESRVGERTAWRLAEMCEVVSLARCPNLRAKAIDGRQKRAQESDELQDNLANGPETVGQMETAEARY